MTFQDLPEGGYTVEDSRRAVQQRSEENFALKYAAVTSIRLLADAIAGLCETVETCSQPQNNEKSRQRRRLRQRGKKHGIREEVTR